MMSAVPEVGYSPETGFETISLQMDNHIDRGPGSQGIRSSKSRAQSYDWNRLGNTLTVTVHLSHDGKGDVSSALDTANALSRNSGMKRLLLSGIAVLAALRR
jgi:hypothetical protein